MGLLLSILAILDLICRDQAPEPVNLDPGLGHHPLVQVTQPDAGAEDIFCLWENTQKTNESASSFPFVHVFILATQCTTLQNPANGQVTVSGTIAVYTCNSGFNLQGSSTRTCQSGFWSGTTPTCTGKTTRCICRIFFLPVEKSPRKQIKVPLFLLLGHQHSFSCFHISNPVYIIAKPSQWTGDS